MPRPIIIAFTGKAGSGKDTAAHYLVERHGFVKISFADTLRDICKTAFGLTDEEMQDRVLKETPLERWPWKTPRHILQVVGTEMFRTHFPGTWTRSLIRKARQHERVVIADCRFPDEADTIRAEDGWVIRLEGRQADIGAGAAHASEAAIDAIVADDTLYNDTCVDDLYSRLEDLLADMGLKRRLPDFGYPAGDPRQGLGAEMLGAAKE